MELKEFVQETLVEIASGISAAQAQLLTDDIKAIINPVWGDNSELHKHVQNVTFDVAVTSSEKTSGSGKAGIKVISAFDLSGDISKEKSNANVSRVSFSIPIVSSYTVVSDIQKS